MIEQKIVADLATIYPLAPNAIGSAGALVNLTPYSLPAVKDSKGYVTFTIIVANRETKALTALPLIYQLEKVPAQSQAANVDFFTTQSILDTVAKYGQVVSTVKPLILQQAVPADDPIWAAAANMGTAMVVFLYQLGENEAAPNSIPPVPEKTEGVVSGTEVSTATTTDTPAVSTPAAEPAAESVADKLVWKIATVVSPDVSGLSVG